MPIRPLAILPDPILRETAPPVPAMSDSIRTLMDDMALTMRVNGGLGLAAAQIGVRVRVIVMECSQATPATTYTYIPADSLAEVADTLPPPKLWKMANPRILAKSDDTITLEEGCLSIPDIKSEVTRRRWVQVRYLAENGQEEDMEAEGLLAVCLQHEIDHLNGKLFIDYLSRAKRDMIIRKFEKEARHARQTPISA